MLESKMERERGRKKKEKDGYEILCWRSVRSGGGETSEVMKEKEKVRVRSERGSGVGGKRKRKGREKKKDTMLGRDVEGVDGVE